MIPFAVGAVLLLLGYVVYGRLVERAVRPDPERVMPAVAKADGVDYVAMPTWRVFLIQLLNIAGLGPVFGPIMGALWGPQVFLWVVIGAVIGGGVHDLLSGAMSVRNGGAGLPDLISRYLGRGFRHLAVAFTLALMILVGTVFVRGPAMLLVDLVPAETAAGWFGIGVAPWLEGSFGGQSAWMTLVMAAIFVYYLLATLLPIDVVIGRLYPLFALALLVMVGGLGLALMLGTMPLPRFTLSNLHPQGLAAWPLIFITVSCGAVSGFHATQSPLMARCLRNERFMRPVFYGAMIAEGLIALVWASAAQGFYGGSEGLAAALAASGPGGVVHTVCVDTMGRFGGFIAVLGVVVLPITSGDTAFRVGRLIVADYVGLNQTRMGNRVLLSAPLFAVSILLNLVDFSIVWRYFGGANQALAAVTLWAGAVFLARRQSRWWLAAIPAVFMTVMTTSYFLVEDVGPGLSVRLGTSIGALVGALALGGFLMVRPRLGPERDEPQPLVPLSDADRAIDDLEAC